MSFADSVPARDAREENVVNCSQCGGPVRHVSGHNYLQCTFCQSLVFDSDTPLTVDRISCQGTELHSTCPSCEQPLKAGTVDERPALYCGSCYGILMKKAFFGSVLGERRSRRAAVDGEEPRPIDTAQYERRLRCPGCRNFMEVHPYFGPGNVVIDSCSNCDYLWLDHGELTRLERAADGRAAVNTYPGLAAPDFSGYAATSPPQPEEQEDPLATLASWLFGIRD